MKTLIRRFIVPPQVDSDNYHWSYRLEETGPALFVLFEDELEPTQKALIALGYQFYDENPVEPPDCPMAELDAARKEIQSHYEGTTITPPEGYQHLYYHEFHKAKKPDEGSCYEENEYRPPDYYTRKIGNSEYV